MPQSGRDPDILISIMESGSETVRDYPLPYLLAISI
jgi:hypothetical protein